MDTAEDMSGQPTEDVTGAPVQGFVVVVANPASGSLVFRVEDPPRLLRVWSLLQATMDELASATLPPQETAALQRQFQVVREELDRAVSPPLAAELQRTLPPYDGEMSADALRVECAALGSWVGGLVLQMLAVFTAVRDRPEGPRGGHGRGTFAPGAA